ncbi:hypothetical protein D3C80_1925910 [compost metagenome]
MVVSMVSVTWVTAGVCGTVTVSPVPPVVPVTVAEIWPPSIYGVSFAGTTTLTLPVVCPAGMTITAPLDRVTTRLVVGAWPTVAV